MITGAQAVVDCLRREHVEHVFGIPGTMNLPILDVLRDTPESALCRLRRARAPPRCPRSSALASGPPAVVDVVIDKSFHAPVVYKA